MSDAESMPGLQKCRSFGHNCCLQCRLRGCRNSGRTLYGCAFIHQQPQMVLLLCLQTTSSLSASKPHISFYLRCIRVRTAPGQCIEVRTNML